MSARNYTRRQLTPGRGSDDQTLACTWHHVFSTKIIAVANLPFNYAASVYIILTKYQTLT